MNSLPRRDYTVCPNIVSCHMEMSLGDRLLADVWNRLVHDWSRVSTFRQMAVLGEDCAREAIHKSNTYFVEQQLLRGQYTHLLKDRDGFIKDGLAARMPSEMTESSVMQFRATLHAAVLVFCHSILDAAVFDCLRICAVCAPNRWVEILGNRKVALTDIATKPFSTLLEAVISDDLVRMERQSLLEKVDRVFQICRPQKSEYLTNGFRFDRDRLSRLDELRHQAVHAPNGTWSFETIYEDIEFMQRSGLHIFSMVGETFDLCFSGREAIELLAARNKSHGS